MTRIISKLVIICPNTVMTICHLLKRCILTVMPIRSQKTSLVSFVSRAQAIEIFIISILLVSFRKQAFYKCCNLTAITIRRDIKISVTTNPIRKKINAKRTAILIPLFIFP